MIPGGSSDGPELRVLGVVGGGFMGRSIAQKAAGEGLEVAVVEASEELARRSRDELARRSRDELARRSRDELVAGLDREHGKWGITVVEKGTLLRRVRFGADLGSAVGR